MSIKIPGLTIGNTLNGVGATTRRAVRAATIVNGNLSLDFANGQTLDGVTLVTGDRILIKNQTSGIENGIYEVQTTGPPIRTSDYDEGEGVASTFVLVKQGTINEDTGWICINDSPNDIVATNALQFMLTTGDVSNNNTGNSTDNAIVRWDGTSGYKIQESGVILDDSDNASGYNNIKLDGYIEVADITTPAAPGVGLGRLYKKTGDDGLFWLPDGAGPEIDLTTTSQETLQDAYNNSTGGATPEIVLDSTRNALTIRDNSTPLSGNLFEVQNNAGSVTYLAADNTGGLINGGLTFTEKAANPFTPSAGQGTIWLRNDTSQKIVFSDDAGADFVMNPLTTKGDLFTHDASEETRLAVGTNGFVLTADSTQPTGMIWKAIAADELDRDLQQVDATNEVSTTSTTYVDMPDMLITVTKSIEYIISFTANVRVSNANRLIDYIINVDGVDIPETFRSLKSPAANDFMPVAVIYKTNVISPPVDIKIRWKKGGGGGGASISVAERILIADDF